MATKVGGIYYEVELDTQKLVAGQRQVNAEVEKAAFSFNQITKAVQIYATVMGALRLVERADEFRLLATRVEVATGSVEAASAAWSELVKISRLTQTSVAANVEVFTRLNQSILQMGGTQADTLRLTDLLAKAIKVSGANATEAKSAMIQFGQALGSGKLAGDELRSLLENAPYLMRQLADGLGVPIGALKKLGEEGKLTSDVVVNAMSKASAQIDADFKKFPQTFAGAMQVLQDSAGMAVLKYDELSGKSAVLTGVTLGLGEVFDKLADQIGAANDKAGILGRNEMIQEWAKKARVAVSYLLDGLALAKRGFEIVTFQFGKATGPLDLPGKQMRDLWDAGAGGGRGFVNPTPAGSKLKPPGGTGDKDKAKFDAEGYLAALNQATLEGLARVDAAEQEALRKNAKLLAEKKINAQQSAEAITLIELKAAEDRLDIQLKNAEGIREAIEKGGKEEAAARAKLAEEQEKGRLFATGLAVEGDPIAKLQLELEQKSALLVQYAAIDQANMEFYAQAKLALETETAARMKAIRDRENEQKLQTQAATEVATYAMAQSSAGQMLDILRRAGKDRTALGKALFLAERALAIATIIVNTEVGAAKAIGIAGPFGIPLATLIRATGYASAAMVGGLAIADAFGGGRQYGGATSAGSLYRINETGRPEMFTASNGAQYMLPTANGNVTPADQVGGGGSVQWQIVVHNNAPGAAASASVDNESRTVTVAINEVARQIGERSGAVWGALRTTNVQGRF